MAHCRNCGSWVTSDYVRVFGEDRETLHACPDCTTAKALARGAGADPESAPDGDSS